MTAAVLAPGGRATTVDAAEGVAREELGTDDVSVVDIVDRRPGPGERRRRVAVVGPVPAGTARVPATSLHVRLDRALRVAGLAGLDATHVLVDPDAPPHGAASAATRRLSVVHALLAEGPAASPSGFTALGPPAHVSGCRGHDPHNRTHGR